MSNLFVKYDNETYWTAYFIKWSVEKEEGIVFLKWNSKKIIGKTALIYKDGKFIEKELSNYNNIDCENIWPYEEFIIKSMEEFWNTDYLTKWFDFKLYMNTKILNDEEHAPTLTTTQNRLPNSGIWVEEETWNIVINYDLKLLKKEKWEQLRLF